MKKKHAKHDAEAFKKAEAFVRNALSARSNKRHSDTKVRSLAKKVSRAIPVQHRP
jgi:hypothetical protein